MPNYPFHERIKPNGYFDKEDDSFLDFYALVRGSYNVIINDEGNVATRKGMSVVGDVSSSGKPILTAYAWETSSAKNINLRCQYDKLQVLYKNVWRDIYTGFKTNYVTQYAKWWDRSEIKDRLLFVNNTTSIHSWTGGMTECISATLNTLTKMYALQSAVANPFVFTAASKTLFQSGAVVSFVTLGFAVGDKVNITGTTNNNGIFTIKTVTADTITFASSDTITNETIATTACIMGVLGRETWRAERFTTTGTKELVVGGTTAAYTGGWDTPTLTGVTVDLSGIVSAGSFVYQKIQSGTPSGGDFVAGTKVDTIGVNVNQAYFGNALNRTLFLSKQSSYTDCGYTSPVRKTGEGGTVYLDNNLVAITPSEGDTFVSAGSSDVYRIYFEAFSDGVNAGEMLRVKKLATANGQGAAGRDAFVKIKNGILFVSNEPTIDYLGSIENIASIQNKPLSDNIKRLLTGLDRGNVSGVYHKNVGFFLFPNSQVLLMYDVQRGFWQPPQVVSGNALSVIDDFVCVHSSTKDETYKLFSGLTDNGAPINASVAINIETGGKRSLRKIYDEAFIEALCNSSAKTVNAKVLFGYRGSGGEHNFTFGFDDDARFLEVPALPSGFGSAPFGYNPLGGLFPDATQDPEIGDLRKVYKVSATNTVETFATQLLITNAESGAYFELLCNGLNTRKGETTNVDIKE